MTISERSIQTPRGAMTWLDAGRGWPVILLHGFPLTADMWRPQLDTVPDGWHFIAPHLRGFGSGPPVEGPMSMADYAADVTALMDALALEDAAIGGLSMGGYITFALHRSAPDRFTRMILADTRAEADTPQGREARIQMRELLARTGPPAIAAQMLPKLLSPLASAETVALVRRTIESAGAPAIDAALGALMDRPDSTAELARISCPVLIAVGDADVITPPSDGERMRSAITRSSLAVIPNAGHLANLEQPAAFSRAVADFLASAL